MTFWWLCSILLHTDHTGELSLQYHQSIVLNLYANKVLDYGVYVGGNISVVSPLWNMYSTV